MFSSRAAVEAAVEARIDLNPIHRYIGSNENIDEPFEFQGWKVKPCQQALAHPNAFDEEGYELVRQAYHAKLLALFRQIKGDPGLTDLDMSRSTFFPLPNRWSKGHWRDPWFATLDNQTLPLDSPDFLEGMIEARNFYKWKNKNPLSALLDRLLCHDSVISWPGRCQDYDESAVVKVENKIRALTDRRSNELVEFVKGFHITMILVQIRGRWAGDTLRLRSIAAEMDTIICALEAEYHAASISYAFIESDDGFPYHRNISLVEGSIYGRLQHICLLTEYAKALHGNVYMKTRAFQEGMCSWFVGWYDAPRKVGSIIYDIFTCDDS